MEVVERNPVPIYEVTCSECKSRIQYKKSEVHFTGYITCPVCGISLWAVSLVPVEYRYEEVEI